MRHYKLIAMHVLLVGIIGCIYWVFLSKQDQAKSSCPANLMSLTTQEERIHCGKEKHERFLQESQHDIAFSENNAFPFIPLPTAQAMRVTPLPSDKVIKKLPLQATLGGPQHIRGATSFWRVGAVPDAEHTDFFPFLVWSKKGADHHAVVETDVLNLGSEAARYRHRWIAPRATGILTITNATGPDETIQFQTSYGLSGTLNLADGAWVFAP